MEMARGPFWQEFFNYGDRSLFGRLISIALLPAALVYRLVVLLRFQFYRIGLFKSYKLQHPVISIGNLTVGGTGKTPLEIYLVKRCLKMGLRPLILSRGYGSKIKGAVLSISSDALPEKGLADEIALLAEHCGDIPIACGKNRYKAYQKACQLAEFDLVILDDGFQHHRIKRDLEILIVDSARPFGTGRLLPAGNLREPKGARKRAAVIIINHKSGGSVGAVIDKIASKNQLLLTGGYRVEEIASLRRGGPVHSALWSNKRAGLLTALADPRAFELTAAGLGIAPVYHFQFRDHHLFSPSDLERISQQCATLGIECLYTTEKDAVKLRKNAFAKPEIFVIKIGFYLIDGAAALDERIAALVRRS